MMLVTLSFEYWRTRFHTLITSLDDILDLMQDVAESVMLYDIRKVTPEAKQLAEICQMSCERVRTAVVLLKNVKDAGGVPFILENSIPSPFLRDILFLAVIFAFFSCGSSIQGASARMLYAYARDGQTPMSGFIAKVSDKHRTPVNALLAK